MPRRKNLTSEQLDDLTASVVGDLRVLRDSDLERPSESVLRDVAARLRRLLHDRTLQQLRKAHGLEGEPRIIAPALPAGGGGVRHRHALGIDRHRIAIQGVTVWNRALSAEDVRASYERLKDSGPPVTERTLSEWLGSKCIELDGVGATRRDVILFVANKLGGVHFDPGRNPKKYPGYVVLDQARSAGTADIDAAYAELTAIAQQLLSSPDVISMTPAD